MDDTQPADEFQLISQLVGTLDSASGVRLGIGDDAAVVSPPPGDLLLCSDLVVEGVHFDLAYTPLEAVGHKALAVNLSDMAAMGATPLWALVAMALPDTIGIAKAPVLYKGISELAKAAGVAVIGGDTTAAGPGGLTVSITLVGTTHGAKPIDRRGAQVGDLICVCGQLGGAAAALERLMAGSPPGNWAQPLFFPRGLVEEGRWLATNARPTSMIDVSDGLLSDLRHLLAKGELASPTALGAQLMPAEFPLSPELAEQPLSKRMALAANGGEDYALLFTLPPNRRISLEMVGAPPVSIIGEITAKTGLTWHPPESAPADLGTPFRQFQAGVS